MKNRLKTMRLIRGFTQTEVCKRVNISQSTYCLWEKGTVRVSAESMLALAKLYNVNIDFLSGRRYRITKPVNTWFSDLQQDWQNGDEHVKAYMEYLYGGIVYEGNPDFHIDSDQKISPEEPELNEGEKMLLELFRQIPDEAQKMYLEVLRASLKNQSKD